MRKQGIDRSDALMAFITSHPALAQSDILATAALLGRCPWPSITGSPPVYRDRPFFDARRERPQFNDNIIDPEDQL